MTNKTERYFVCSESDLERLRDESFANGAGLGHAMQAMAEAEAACRAREVPEGTRFLDCFHTDAMEKLGSLMLWEIKK